MPEIRRSTPADVPVLLAIWRKAVLATHDFLLPGDFSEIERQIATEYLPRSPVWVAVDAADRPLAFMGMTHAHIDSLFVDPAFRGRGMGRMLVEHARSLEAALGVDVNEQNAQAVGFYKRMGFVERGRSARDDQGRPYPLLHMALWPGA